MNTEEKKVKLEQIKKEIRKRNEDGEYSDELVNLVLEATRLADEISISTSK